MNKVPRRLGKYELRTVLGRGGMAEVWQAYDTQLRRTVAIKFMHASLAADPGFVARFTHEAQTVAALRHPNIVQIYDFYTSDDERSQQDDADGDGITAYMVMEYIKGQTLAHYIGETSRQQQFPAAATIIRLFAPISLALDYAHHQGAIHRDIKPANILLDQTNTARNPMGEPILSDFGLAKLLGESSQTVSGAVIGTPLYMSPEQIQGKAVGPRSDLYSLAVVLYELCAGAPPFTSDSLTGIMMQHLTEPPPAPDTLNPQLPAALTPVLLKALAKDPADRYPSAAALTAAVAGAFKTPVPQELKAALATAGASGDAVEETLLAGPTSTASVGSGATISAGQATVTSLDGGTLLAAPTANTADEKTLLVAPTSARARPAPPAVGAREQSASAPEATPAVSAPTSAPPTAGASLTAPFANVPALRQLQGWRLLVAIVVLVALLGSGLGAILLLTHHATAAPTANSPVGQAYFVSSGHVNQDATQGINDEFQITLKGIPSPATGKAYYGWLLPDNSASDSLPDILLGKLPITNGAINYLYPGDSQHTNLLGMTSRFLITEEDANVAPQVPTPDLTAWRYYAALPQTIPSGQKYSLLDHLRHLLASDPDLMAYDINGGLNIWTYREIQSVAQWAQTLPGARNGQDYDYLRRQLVAILDYLDGSQNVNQDVPAGTPVQANQQLAQIGLLEFDPATQNPPGYLYHIALHLNGVLASPGATQFQRDLAIKINTSLTNLRVWLTQARHDAAQLLTMSDAQLGQSSTQAIVNDLVTMTTGAYQGRINPTTHKHEDGDTQLAVQIQRLANFSVTAYKQ